MTITDFDIFEAPDGSLWFEERGYMTSGGRRWRRSRQYRLTDGREQAAA